MLGKERDRTQQHQELKPEVLRLVSISQLATLVKQNGLDLGKKSPLSGTWKPRQAPLLVCVQRASEHKVGK